MQTMWHQHPDIDKPYTLDDLEQTLAETTGDKQFAHEMFADHIRGLKPLDYAQLVAPAGLILTLAHPGKPWLGASRLNATPSGLDVAAPTLRGSPLYLAGVDSGDQIQECDHESVKTLSKIDSCLANKKPGDTVILTIKGRAGSRSVSIPLAQDPVLELITFERAGKSITPEIKDFRSQWLSSRAAK
jgi:predicted metalloprotease with PDZ domain